MLLIEKLNHLKEEMEKAGISSHHEVREFSRKEDCKKVFLATDVFGLLKDSPHTKELKSFSKPYSFWFSPDSEEESCLINYAEFVMTAFFNDMREKYAADTVENVWKRKNLAYEEIQRQMKFGPHCSDFAEALMEADSFRSELQAIYPGKPYMLMGPSRMLAIRKFLPKLKEKATASMKESIRERERARKKFERKFRFNKTYHSNRIGREESEAEAISKIARSEMEYKVVENYAMTMNSTYRLGFLADNLMEKGFDIEDILIESNSGHEIFERMSKRALKMEVKKERRDDFVWEKKEYSLGKWKKVDESYLLKNIVDSKFDLYAATADIPLSNKGFNEVSFFSPAQHPLLENIFSRETQKRLYVTQSDRMSAEEKSAQLLMAGLNLFFERKSKLGKLVKKAEESRNRAARFFPDLDMIFEKPQFLKERTKEHLYWIKETRRREEDLFLLSSLHLWHYLEKVGELSGMDVSEIENDFHICELKEYSYFDGFLATPRHYRHFFAKKIPELKDEIEGIYDCVSLNDYLENRGIETPEFEVIPYI